MARSGRGTGHDRVRLDSARLSSSYEPSEEQEALDAPPHPYFAKHNEVYRGPNETLVNGLLMAASRIARGAVKDGTLLVQRVINVQASLEMEEQIQWALAKARALRALASFTESREALNTASTMLERMHTEGGKS